MWWHWWAHYSLSGKFQSIRHDVCVGLWRHITSWARWRHARQRWRSEYGLGYDREVNGQGQAHIRELRHFYVKLTITARWSRWWARVYRRKWANRWRTGSIIAWAPFGHADAEPQYEAGLIISATTVEFQHGRNCRWGWRGLQWRPVYAWWSSPSSRRPRLQQPIQSTRSINAFLGHVNRRQRSCTDRRLLISYAW